MGFSIHYQEKSFKPKKKQLISKNVKDRRKMTKSENMECSGILEKKELKDIFFLELMCSRCFHRGAMTSYRDCVTLYCRRDAALV